MSNSLRICIAHPNPGPQCESFIQALIDNLPGVCEVLYGGHMPCFDGSGRSLTPEPPSVLPPEFSPDGVPTTARHQKYFDALVSHLQRVRPDVVLAEYGPTGVAFAVACRRLGIPLVVKFHGYDSSVRETIEKYRSGYTLMFEQAHAIIGVSKSMVQALEALGAPRGKLHVIPTGVDTRRFHAATPETAPPNFVAVGRFVNKKAPHLTLCAFQRVLEEIPDATLTMIGDGPLWEACRGVCKAMKIENNVYFPGRISQGEVASALRMARVFVQHSVTAMNGDKEGTPNAVLEAGASGLPVVATRHAGIAEAVIHEETGLLCEEMDVDTMSAYFLRMALEPKTASRLGRNARIHVKAKYDMRQCMDALERILNHAARKEI